MTNLELRSDLIDTKSDVFSFGIWFISSNCDLTE